MSKKASKKAAGKKSGKSAPAKKNIQKKVAKASAPARQAGGKKSPAKAAKKAISAKKKPLTKSNKPSKKTTKTTAKKSVKKIAKKAIKVPAKKALPAKKNIKPASRPAAVKQPATKTQQKNNTKPSLKQENKTVSASNSISVPKADNKLKSQNTAPVKERDGKFELEYLIHTSMPILYEFLTTPSGLSEWFCDDVNIRNGIYTFQWDENMQQAKLVKAEEDSLVRYQWLDKADDGSYFEFRIERDDLTNDVSLIVADFADSADERISSTQLWNSQIDKLLHVLGSHL